MASKKAIILEANRKHFAFGLDWFSVRGRTDPRVEAMRQKKKKQCTHYFNTGTAQYGTCILDQDADKLSKKDLIYPAAYILSKSYKDMIGFWRMANNTYWLIVIKGGQIQPEVGDYVAEDFQDISNKFFTAYEGYKDKWEKIIAPEQFELENSEQLTLGNLLIADSSANALEVPPNYIITTTHKVFAGVAVLALGFFLWDDLTAEFSALKRAYWDDPVVTVKKVSTLQKLKDKEEAKVPEKPKEPWELLPLQPNFTESLNICLQNERIIRVELFFPGWERGTFLCQRKEEAVTFNVDFRTRDNTPLSSAFDYGLTLGGANIANWNFSTKINQNLFQSTNIMTLAEFHKALKELADDAKGDMAINVAEKRTIKIVADFEEQNWSLTTSAIPALWVNGMAKFPAVSFDSLSVTYNPLQYSLKGKAYVTP